MKIFPKIWLILPKDVKISLIHNNRMSNKKKQVNFIIKEVWDGQAAHLTRASANLAMLANT